MNSVFWVGRFPRCRLGASKIQAVSLSADIPDLTTRAGSRRYPVHRTELSVPALQTSCAHHVSETAIADPPQSVGTTPWARSQRPPFCDCLCGRAWFVDDLPTRHQLPGDLDQ